MESRKPRAKRPGRPPWIFLACALVALMATCADAFAATRGPAPAAPHTPGGGLLINGRTITPAGSQSRLGDLPVNAVLSPDGGHLLVVNSGAGVQSVQVVATKTGAVVQTIPYLAPDSAFVGAAYSPDGAQAYVAGGGSGAVHTFAVAGDGTLTKQGDIQLGAPKQNPFPIGLSVSPDGARLAVANNLANDVALVDLRSRHLVATIPVGGYPYAALFSRDGARLYVSNWANASLSVIDVAGASVTETVEVGQHPNTMLWTSKDRLAVADANSDAVSLVDTRSNRETARVSVRPYAGAPAGSSPQGLAASPD
ncbi:MAG: YncE family protein, partial [Candidatus Dormibacteraeota bacterium]|nr:YncE family protein [Candidatus Dormibacteraeota bacterium]